MPSVSVGHENSALTLNTQSYRSYQPSPRLSADHQSIGASSASPGSSFEDDSIETGLVRFKSESSAARASEAQSLVRSTGKATKKSAILAARVIGAPLAGASFLAAGACATAAVAAAVPGFVVGASLGMVVGLCSDSSTARCMAGGAKFGASVTGFVPFLLSLVFVQAGSAPYGFNGAMATRDLINAVAYSTARGVVNTVHAFDA